MKILLIGQCTLQMGRMEFGNIGNYSIIEPFVRELHHVFPKAEIKTTFQMTEEFCKREHIKRCPMELYYSWSEKDTELCLSERSSAAVFHQTGHLPYESPFIREVLDSDLVIDFSGDMWGDNADLLGKNRFLVGAYKDLTVHLLGKPVAMLAGSPGPFEHENNCAIAQEVFPLFDLVTNREPVTKNILEQYAIYNSNMLDLACPAFLFEPKSNEEISPLLLQEGLLDKTRPAVGFILCGWNMIEGPFNKWPRDDSEYIFFAELLEYFANEVEVDIYLMSHSNGFDVNTEFTPIHGRDYPIIKQLQNIVQKRGKARNIKSLDGIYSPAETKAIIGKFDMLISGRLHGAVAGLSQSVPTVLIDYGHEPKAHKLRGFAAVAGVDEYVADPCDPASMKRIVMECWQKRSDIKKFLDNMMPVVKEKARENFRLLTTLVKPH